MGTLLFSFPSPDVFFAYLSTGAVAGFFAGLLGIGGGVVVVPLLSMIFADQGYAPREVLHLALGTSMATILFTSVASLRAHHRHRAVIWPVVVRITPGILAGTLLGAQLAAAISSAALSLFFAIFMLAIAIQMSVNLRPKPSRTLPGRVGLTGAGVIIGGIASLAALGGGALTVPYLVRCNVPAHQAIGTSAAVGLPIAIGGTVGYVLNGWGRAGLPGGSLGFVYLPALATLLLASVFLAPIGARLAHRMPVATLKRAFAALLVILAAKMVASLFSAP